MPPSACSKRPWRLAVAPVNAPFSWPKSSLSMSVGGSAARFTAMNGPSTRREKRCTARATSSLPVPVSPVIKTGVSEAAARPMSFQIVNIAALVPTSWRFGSRRTGVRDRKIAGERVLLERALDGRQELLQVERLGEVVERAVPHRRDGPLAVAVSGRDDDRHVAHRPLADLAQEIEAAPVSQAKIEEDAVDRPGLERLPRLGQARRGDSLLSEATDGRDQTFSNPRLVFDDQNRAHVRAFPSDSSNRVASPSR